MLVKGCVSLLAVIGIGHRRTRRNGGTRNEERRTKNARVTHTQNIRLLATLGPELVELLRVPHGLEEQSGDVYGVRGRAGPVGDEYASGGVDVLVEGDVALQLRRWMSEVACKVENLKQR